MIKAPRPRRWIVVCGSVVGAVILGLQLNRGDSFFRSLTEALGIAFLAMVVCGVAARFWQGDDLSTANVPGIAGIGFPEAIEPIETVNRRVDAQVGELEKRVYALEEEKEAENGSAKESAHEADEQE